MMCCKGPRGESGNASRTLVLVLATHGPQRGIVVVDLWIVECGSCLIGVG